MARTPRYTRHLRVMVTPEIRARLDQLESEHPESISDIVREALVIGLPRVESRMARRAVRRNVGVAH